MADDKLASLLLGQGAPPLPLAAEEEGAGSGDDGLQSAADDLMTAIEAKDSAGIAAAFRAAFQMLESEPHDEGSEG